MPVASSLLLDSVVGMHIVIPSPKQPSAKKQQKWLMIDRKVAEGEENAAYLSIKWPGRLAGIWACQLGERFPLGRDTRDWATGQGYPCLLCCSCHGPCAAPSPFLKTPAVHNGWESDR